MKIVLNGREREVADGTTVQALLEGLGLADRLVAVEVNREVVRKEVRAEKVLKDGDRVEIVTLVAGG